MIKDKNHDASIITTSWDLISGVDILDSIEQKFTITEELEELKHHHHLRLLQRNCQLHNFHRLLSQNRV
jgi:hypothetical protein